MDGLEIACVVNNVLKVVGVGVDLDVGWEDTGVDVEVDSGTKSGRSVVIEDGSIGLFPDPDPDSSTVVATNGAEVTASVVLTGWGNSTGNTISRFWLQKSPSSQQA